MASSKRKRVDKLNSSKSDSPSSSEAQVRAFECLMQASKKELGQLLSVLIKASTDVTLAAVETEAVRIGALPPVDVKITSKMQKSTPRQLDWIFSFLGFQDLKAADVVCRRWRSATRDSLAGWLPYFNRRMRDHLSVRLVAQMELRRVSPDRLGAVDLNFRNHIPGVMRFISRLPALRRLSTGQSANLTAFKSLKSMASVSVLESDSGDEWPLPAHLSPDLLRVVRFGKHSSPINGERFIQLSKFKSLELLEANLALEAKFELPKDGKGELFAKLEELDLTIKRTTAEQSDRLKLGELPTDISPFDTMADAELEYRGAEPRPPGNLY